MVTNLSATPSILSEWIRELRDTGIQGRRAGFRRNLEKIGEVAAYEISKTLPYRTATVTTPMGTASCLVLEQQPVLATILRAGLPLQTGILNYFPDADCAFIGAYRKHSNNASFVINQQYVTSPPLENRPLVIADPMLATGASMALALATLMEYDKPSQVHVVAAIACTTGIDYVLNCFPDVHIWVGAIDEKLTDEKYIVPGLGDAGDLAFGKKRQF